MTSQSGCPSSTQRLSTVGLDMNGDDAIEASDDNDQAARRNTCGFASFWLYLSSNPRLRKALAHVGLVLLLAFYTAAGALVCFDTYH